MKWTFVLLLGLAACATAGPYVTEVRPLPNGAIRVKKCFVAYTWGPLGDNVYTGECREETVKP